MSGNAAKAIAALRAGRPVRIGSEGGPVVLAVETATPEMLEVIDPKREATLLISGARAAALSLANAREAADPGQPVAIAREAWLDAAAAVAIADPGRDFERGPIGPLEPIVLNDPEAAAAALRLAALAGLLPALWQMTDPAGTATLEYYQPDPAAAGSVSLVARARLPIEDLADSQVAVFRSNADGQEHLALIVGAFGGEPPLLRLHSECLTGDVFGSLKCDCGLQLKEALRLIGVNGGVLLYLRQEGRGIGLANKIRAYALQDRGMDTVDANARLGFADDPRTYEDAAAILTALGIGRVRLLTNNPAKVEALADTGIEVVERVAHHMPANPHNADYLEVKQRRSGHLP